MRVLIVLTCSSFVRASAKESGWTSVRSNPEMSSRLSLNLSCNMIIMMMMMIMVEVVAMVMVMMTTAMC